jgi:hypothetical protein
MWLWMYWHMNEDGQLSECVKETTVMIQFAMVMTQKQKTSWTMVNAPTILHSLPLPSEQDRSNRNLSLLQRVTTLVWRKTRSKFKQRVTETQYESVLFLTAQGQIAKWWDLRFSRLWRWWCSGFRRPEGGDSMFLRNVGIYRRVYTAPKPRRT